MLHTDTSIRSERLIKQAEEVLATRKSSQYGNATVNIGQMAGLRASSLSFIATVYGDNHSHFSEFDAATDKNYEANAQKAYAILKSIKEEIDEGWIFSVKQIVSAEIFADFIEMAEHLLKQGYKDAAAVMTGSVLEENLRQLCIREKIDTTYEKDGSIINKKADRLNADLAKADIYNKLDQKSVTTWLDLRNNAAHGAYSEYNKEQVAMMLGGVTEFISRTSR